VGWRNTITYTTPGKAHDAVEILEKIVEIQYPEGDEQDSSSSSDSDADTVSSLGYHGAGGMRVQAAQPAGDDDGEEQDEDKVEDDTPLSDAIVKDIMLYDLLGR
jgi:hypothetical protein